MPYSRLGDRLRVRLRVRDAVLLAGLAWTASVGLSAVAKGPAELTSSWRAEPVVVDGKPDEWTALVPFEAAHLAVGVSNDASTLQLAITSSDQARRRQMIAAGVIVWLDPSGGKKRAVGIRFPGEIGGDRDRPELGRRRPEEPRVGTTPPEPPPLSPLTWFELVGPRDEDRRRLQRSAVTSIQVARDLKEGLLVFELQIPLAKDAASGFGIGAEAGRMLGLGLETPEREKPEGPPPGAGGRRMGGGGGGMGGGIGGGLGGRGRGGMGGGRPDDPAGPEGKRPERAKPLKLWTTVQLATGS
jgi:hypothetical protein